MPRLTRWLAVGLVAALAVGGWLGWQQARWRQLYYAEVTAQLVFDVDMARRALVRASETSDYGQRREAMATAGGYIESAYNASLGLLARMAPDRTGHPTYMPGRYVPAVFQYARQLTPDLPNDAVQKRIELLNGLEMALKAGQTKTWIPPAQAYQVDVSKLKGSLDEYFRNVPKSDARGTILEFADDPNQPTLTATSHGSDEVDLRVEWTRTWKLFPLASPGYFVLVHSGTGVQVTSDAGQQPRMGGDPLAPFDTLEWSAELHEGFKGHLPADWPNGSYTVIRIPEGLAQTLTIRLPASSQPSLLLLQPLSGNPAVPVPVSTPLTS